MSEEKKNCPRCAGSGKVRIKINSRSKGQRGEREVISYLQPVCDRVTSMYGLNPVLLQRNQLQSHLGGSDICGLPAFAFEVKYCENAGVGSWWLQCVNQAKKQNAVPVLLYRSNGTQWQVKFRAYVNTPFDRDQIEMDVTASFVDFLSWFENAVDELLKPQQA